MPRAAAGVAGPGEAGAPAARRRQRFGRFLNIEHGPSTGSIPKGTENVFTHRLVMFRAALFIIPKKWY